jgi:hypothetical protein
MNCADPDYVAALAHDIRNTLSSLGRSFEMLIARPIGTDQLYLALVTDYRGAQQATRYGDLQYPCRSRNHGNRTDGGVGVWQNDGW